jgi:phasin family protein
MRKSGKTTTKNRAAKINITRGTARTVRAAAANTSERISGPAHDAARAGLNAASEASQHMADQITQLFGMTGEQSEELARRSAQSIEAVTEASTVMARGFQDLSREMMTLAQERIQRNMDAFAALSRSRSIHELFTLQSELFRDNLQHTLESTRRIAEVSTRMAGDATQTMARQARTSGQRRAA